MVRFVEIEYGVLNGIIILTALVLICLWLRERRNMRKSKEGLLDPVNISHNSSK